MNKSIIFLFALILTASLVFAQQGMQGARDEMGDGEGQMVQTATYTSAQGDEIQIQVQEWKYLHFLLW